MDVTVVPSLRNHDDVITVVHCITFYVSQVALSAQKGIEVSIA
jgi:hypothetical protein